MSIRVVDHIRGRPHRIEYTCDFGDNWQHALALEDFVEAELLAILADPAHPEDDECIERARGPIDPAVRRRDAFAKPEGFRS